MARISFVEQQTTDIVIYLAVTNMDANYKCDTSAHKKSHCTLFQRAEITFFYSAEIQTKLTDIKFQLFVLSNKTTTIFAGH